MACSQVFFLSVLVSLLWLAAKPPHPATPICIFLASLQVLWEAAGDGRRLCHVRHSFLYIIYHTQEHISLMPYCSPQMKTSKQKTQSQSIKECGRGVKLLPNASVPHKNSSLWVIQLRKIIMDFCFILATRTQKIFLRHQLPVIL